MSETTQERAEVLKHATCISEYIERHTTLSADGAYHYLMSYINALEDANKPRTVEDVLREFAQEMNENMGMYTSEAIDADEWRDADGKTITKYADELRELMEVK